MCVCVCVCGNLSLTKALFRKYLKNSCSSKPYLQVSYKSSSNSWQIKASFQSYFQKYDRSRRQLPCRSPGKNGLILHHDE